MNRYTLSIVFLLGLLINAYAQDEKDKVIIGAVVFPPYTIDAFDEGGQMGFDYDVMTEVFKRMGEPLEIRYMPWKRALQMANNGAIAGVLTCSPRNQFHMSDTISSGTDALFVRDSFDSERYKITSIADLKNHPALAIGGVDGYKQLKQLDAEGLPYDKSPDDSAGFKKLFAGRIDVFMTVKEFGDYTLRQLDLSNFVKRIPLAKKEYAVCFSKSHPDGKILKDRFNQILQEVRNDGTYDAIHANYR